MLMRTVIIGFALVESITAFSGLAPMGLRPACQRSVSHCAVDSSMKIGVFYATTSGHTKFVAEKIAGALNVDEAFDIGAVDSSTLANYDTLILGSPTWNTNADTQRSGTPWDVILYDEVKGKMDFSGKKVAFFGCGDSQCYNDYFCDAMGELHDIFAATGANVIGKVPVSEAIECMESKAIKGDMWVGLATDEDNHDDTTDERVAAWTAQLKSEGAD